MPKITDLNVLDVLQNPYFAQHATMHLSRRRVKLPNGKKVGLILPPCLCDDCKDSEPSDAHAAAMDMPGMGGGGDMPGMGGGGDMPGTDDSGMQMKEAGTPGSGSELLEMHHEMLRVLRFLLEHHDPPLRFLAEWRKGSWQRPNGGNAGYGPVLWDLDDPHNLPHEITGMFQVTDPDYLRMAFDGVKALVESKAGKVDDAVDKLGRFIEEGVEDGPPDGSGIHDTLHEFLAAREGKAAQGAELNNLTNSRFNDYFWSIHLWIDGQYGRLLEKRGQKFDTSGLDPKTLDMCTGKMSGKKAMSMMR